MSEAVPTPSLLRWVAEKVAWARVSLSSRLSAYVWLRACDVVGAHTRTFWRPHIENRGRIVIGSRVRINSHWAPVELVTGPQGVIDIADGVYINYGTLISAHSRVRIRADVMVGNYSIIGDTDVPGIGEPRSPPLMEARSIEIGAGAWLAARVTVLPGAQIGAGAVIAAGSVVAGEIPPNAVAGGIPARLLRTSPPAVVAVPGPAVPAAPGG
jgi:carbonic anhydrase/acetyltransferase-like protein (isoleucine patch superfamily)